MPPPASESLGVECARRASKKIYYSRVLAIAFVVFAGIWALSGVIIATTLQEYQSDAKYKCWACVKGCKIQDIYCKGEAGQVGYDVGAINSWIFTILGSMSCISSFGMFFGIIMNTNLRRNIMAFLLGLMAICDMSYALNFVGFGIAKLASNEYPYEPTKSACDVYGFIGQFASVASVVFYIGFSVMTTILIKAPFFFDRLKKNSQARAKCLLAWVGLAVMYAIITGVIALTTGFIGVTSDGTCWVERGLEWTFYIPMIAAVIYSFVLSYFLMSHRMECANLLARKYFVFVVAFIVYNICGVILTLMNAGQDHPMNTGWGNALLETATVISTVLQGLFNSLVYFYVLKVKKDSVTLPVVKTEQTRTRTSVLNYD